MFEDPSGGQHSFAISSASSPNACIGAVIPIGSVYNGGDDFYRVHTATLPGGGAYVPATSVADADGTAYSFSGGTSMHFIGDDNNADGTGEWGGFPSTIANRNGSAISINDTYNPNGEGPFSYSDLNPSSSNLTGTRTLLSVSGFGTVGGSGDSATVSGLSNPYKITWQTLSPATFTSTYTPHNNVTGTNACNAWGANQLTSLDVVSEIDLPNDNPNGTRQRYVFTYDPTYDLISSITYPNGASVRYTWQMNTQSEFTTYEDTNYIDPNGQGCGVVFDVPALQQRIVNDGSQDVLKQTFTYTTNWNTAQGSYETWSTKTTTVKNYDLVRDPTGQTYFQAVYTYGSVPVTPPPNALGASSAQIAVENTETTPDQTVHKYWQDQYLMSCVDSKLSGYDYTATTYFYTTVGGQQTEKDEYDYDTRANGTCSYIVPASPGGGIRQTVTTYASFASYANHPYMYQYGQSIFDRPATINVTGTGGDPAEITYNNYDDFGNPASTTRKCLNSNNCSYDLVTGFTFDTSHFNQITQMTDPGTNPTTYTWGSGYNYAYLTQIAYPPTSGVQHTVSFTYDLASGSLTSETDQNGNPTNYSYADPLARLTESDFPDGGKTTETYNDGAYTPSIVTTKTNSPNNLETTAVMNGMGQVTETQVNTAPEGVLKSDMTYDGFGRKYQEYNPYYTTRGSTPFTTYTYDTAGRVTRVDNPDTTHTTSTFASDCSTVTDPANKVRTLCNDALGRLQKVYEDPLHLNYQTTYSYDVMNKLLTVAQGSQTRTFTYDSFSRLITANNPETGTIAYAYQNSDGSSCGGSRSSVCTRTDARSIITSYGYDADNRLLYKNYSDTTTVRACYAYDGQNGWGNTMNNPIGHLTSSWGITHAGAVVSGNESWDWDTMGRLRGQMQCTPSKCGSSSGYDVYATYDLLGNQTSVWDSSVSLYPTYDGANRLAGMTAGLNVQAGTPGPGSQALISISAYDPFGGLTNATLGNTRTETRSYNSRGWVGSIVVTGLYSVSLNYYGNGSVQTANDNYNGNWTYTYDALDRLQTASMTGQSFTYSPDRYGNMTCTNTGSLPCTPLGLTFNTANNRINDGTHTYDLAGNMTADGTHGYVYDGESRVTCILGTDGTCTSAGATVYYYDADGRRVAKYTGAGTVIEEYVYDLKGDQSSAHDGSGNLIRAELYSPDGRHVATWKNGSLTYHHADWLGTERMRTNSAGAEIEACSDTPYGMNLVCAGTDISPMHFTGKQLDSESNNTYFGARYYATTANLGRFMTPDWSDDEEPVPYAKLDNPQTLNLYAYLRNNPLNTVDPDGHGNLYDPFPYCILPGGEVSDLKHKNHPFNPTITYDQGLSPKDLAIAKKKVGAAIELINSKWSELSEFQQNVLSLMKTIDVFGGSRGGIDPKTFDFALSFGDNVSSSSTACIASDIAHDSYHLYQQFTMGPPTREGALSRESSATRFEIGVGRTLGLTRDEIRFLNDAAAHPENYWRFEVH